MLFYYYLKKQEANFNTRNHTHKMAKNIGQNKSIVTISTDKTKVGQKKKYDRYKLQKWQQNNPFLVTLIQNARVYMCKTNPRIV